MGAWGAGGFENDDALDWAADISSPVDIETFFSGLPLNDESPPPEADVACQIVAAAEAVAALMGRPGPDFPDDLAKRLDDAEASPELIEQAKHVLSAMLGGSELQELWADSDDGGEEWNVAITGLIDRLNPELPFDPPPREQMEQYSGYLTRCAFCDGEIAEGGVFNLEFRDYSSSDGLFLSRGLYCHLKCLNGKLHPKHLLQNWKFDPDQLPPLQDLLD